MHVIAYYHASQQENYYMLAEWPHYY